MDGSITWVGIDAHKKTLAVAVLSPGSKVADEFTVDNTESAIRKLGRRLRRAAKGKEVRACYEAGTCGFTLQRRLDAAGIMCDVIAPSLIPRKTGERIKTDRRDALKLAELSRADVLTAVSPPTLEQEAMRDLCRCREAARADLHRVRHRLIKMLVRRGLVFDPHQRLSNPPRGRGDGLPRRLPSAGDSQASSNCARR
jgi:transposase